MNRQTGDQEFPSRSFLLYWRANAVSAFGTYVTLLETRHWNFPLGTAYYFCHAGDAVGYPTGGAVTSHCQITLTRFDAAFESGLCAGSGNTWIGFQATDGNDYYSNQVVL